MSDSDSFINEVSEEVRKDALYSYARKYGWIAVLAILGIVGGAAWNEYSKAQTRDAARATGDQLINALNMTEADARANALGAVEASGPAQVITALLQAGSQIDADDTAGAHATLTAVASDPETPALYRDLAAFKAAMIDVGDADARRAALETLGQPGATYGLLAQEQIALMDLGAGDTDAALVRLRAIAEDAGVSRGLLQRVQTLMVALGEDLIATPDATASE